MQLIIYGIYLFLAVFNAGNMTTLQLQHYSIYPFVAKENFKSYIKANNKSAFVPSILPAVLLFITNVVLLFTRPPFMTATEAIVFLALNVIAMTSTFVWQRKLQDEMANTGYDESKISLLITTNWIRTIVFLLQAIAAVIITTNAIAFIPNR